MDWETVQTTLLDSMDWEETLSVSKARTFITAARRYLVLCPTNSSQAAGSIGFDLSELKDQIKAAQDFIRDNDTAANAGGGGVRFLGVGVGFRG